MTSEKNQLENAGNVDLFKIFADDKRMILYRPEWRQITGSVTSTILLQQIIFHWDKNGRKPFYKFKEPCEHQLYKAGDSWCEELGFSRAEFDFAIKKIGFKKSKKRNEIHELPVEYWIESSRLTYYSIHTENMSNRLLLLYNSVKRETHFRKSEKLTIGKERNSLYEKRETHFTSKARNSLYEKRVSDFTINTETTTENTKTTATERDFAAAAVPFSLNSSPQIQKALPKYVVVNQDVEQWFDNALKTYPEEVLTNKIAYAKKRCRQPEKFFGYLSKILDEPQAIEIEIKKEQPKPAPVITPPQNDKSDAEIAAILARDDFEQLFEQFVEQNKSDKVIARICRKIEKSNLRESIKNSYIRFNLLSFVNKQAAL